MKSYFNFARLPPVEILFAPGFFEIEIGIEIEIGF
jgi:hypothetical protein